MEDISKISDIIRKKYAKIRNRTRDRDLKLQQSLKPVTDPLRELIRGKELSPNYQSIFLPKTKPDADGTQYQSVFPSSTKTKPQLIDEDDDMLSITPSNASSISSTRSPSTRRTTRSSEIYGVRNLKGGKYIGNQEVSFEGSGINLEDGSYYAKTPGLMVLLTSKHPFEMEYNQTDLDNYRDILERTSAHRVDYDPEKGIKKDNTFKYKSIIKPLFTEGDGLQLAVNNKQVEYRYWDDVNELVSRLILLHASKSAGHTGHDNEIISIIEELREREVIE